jgi:hypothetical protein
MTSMKMKAVYGLLISSFVVWIASFFSVCFPSGVWSTPIRFPDSLSFGVFFGSATVAAVSTMVIGMEYVGLISWLKCRNRKTHFSLLKQDGNIQLSAISSIAEANSISDSTSEEPVKFLMNSEVDEEQESQVITE